MKVGDLVKMKGFAYDTGLVGIVIDRDYHRSSVQIAIKWFKGSGKVDWEPETWLEVVSESG